MTATHWIRSLSPALEAQAAVLTRLLDHLDPDVRIRAFSVTGSFARDQADELSDLDTRIWASDDDFNDVVGDLPRIARTGGKTLDILFETPGSPFLFVQYADGVQVELLVVRASDVRNGVHEHVVLLDRDAIFDDAPEAPPPWGIGLWIGWGWMRLYDLDKDLRRGEVWRAFVQLQEIRNLLLRQHAAVEGVPDPELGLISIRNYGATLPNRLDETVARLDSTDIRRAAVVCAELLSAHEQRPFTNYVLARLAARTKKPRHDGAFGSRGAEI